VPTLLNINNYHYRRGGADVAYLNQAQLFGEHGWNVASFAMKHANNIPSVYSSYFVDEIEFGHRYGAARVLTNAAKSIYSWEASSKVTQLIHDVGADVAHGHNVYHHLSPSVLRAAKRTGIPVFMTLHDFKLLCPARTMISNDLICEACKPNRLRSVLQKRCLKSSFALSALIYAESSLHRLMNVYRSNVDRFIAPSQFIVDKFVEWGWEPERFAHIPNYVDPSHFQPEYAPGEAFLYFGRLSPEKGLATLIRAAARAKVPVWLVGTGPQEADLRQLAQELGAEVEFLGFRTGEALWRSIRGCRAVVIPSEWYENAPISILEAYSLGKPIIGADIGGIPEMIRNDETGRLFPSKDVEQLAEVLSEFAAKPSQKIDAYGRAGRRMVEERFSPERYYERLSALFESFGVPLPEKAPA
jgi:glycosyltransferase involved in cell wall biosynthesis